MSKILDMAKGFEQSSMQQANDIEGKLGSVFEAHERAIKKALNSSEQSIKDAIHDQQSQIGWILVKNWGWMLVCGLFLLSAMSGILWYQGKLIAERYATLETLKAKGGALTTATCGDDRKLCILMDEKEGKFEGGYRIPKGY